MSRFLKGLDLILTGSAVWLSWYLERKIIMLLENICMSGADDQYLDDKAGCYNYPYNLSGPSKALFRLMEL
jgi:hypothetical protein